MDIYDAISIFLSVLLGWYLASLYFRFQRDKRTAGTMHIDFTDQRKNICRVEFETMDLDTIAQLDRVIFKVEAKIPKSFYNTEVEK